MGQAKQRGTLEERKWKAEQRNLAIQSQIQNTPSLRAYNRIHGTQKLITKLVMGGAFNHIK